MGSKISNIEVVFIYFLLLIPWPHTHVFRLLCSKDSSRLVRKIVRSKLTPILDKYQVKLPLECPLHPLRDLFAPRHDAKKRDRPTQWTCRLCGKSFYQEKFLDLHFENRHAKVINEAEEAVCLADFCDILRCEVFQSEESSSLRNDDQPISTDIEVWGDSLGQNSALAKANSAYLRLLPIRTSAIGAVSRAAKVQNRQLYQESITGQNNFQSQTDKSILYHGIVSRKNLHQHQYRQHQHHHHHHQRHQHQQQQPLLFGDEVGGSVATTVSSNPSAPYKSGRHLVNPKDSSSTVSTGSSSSISVGATTATNTLGAAIKAAATATASTTTTTTSSSTTSSDSSASHSASTVQNQSTEAQQKQQQQERNLDSEKNASEQGSNQSRSTEQWERAAAAEENDTVAENENEGDSLQRSRTDCRSEELSRLKTKCELLIRMCIGGLLLQMTDQSFKDMEEEINKAVCWYLTCERYWEDGPLEPRAFPWGLILILIFVLSIGICFCYYIIWILFDSEETTINTTTNHYAYLNPYPPAGVLPPPPPPSSSSSSIQHSQDRYHYQPSDVAANVSLPHHAHLEVSNSNQYAYYPAQQQQHQQQQQQQHQQPTAAALDSLVYGPEAVAYADYHRRNSPRHSHYAAVEMRPPGTPPTVVAQTPLRHVPATSLAAYHPQDLMERREYIARPIATTAVSGGYHHQHHHHSSGQQPPPPPVSSSTSIVVDPALTANVSGTTVGYGSVAGKHYHTIPRPIETRQRYVSGSQQSLRASTSTHEIVQNEVGNNEHYIYVTYPPDLRKRYPDKYE